LRFLLALALLACPCAFAQLQYSTAAGSGYKALDGAVLDSATKYNVRWAGCVPPMDFKLTLNGVVTTWHENTVPCDWQGDPNLVSFAPGQQTLEVVGQPVKAVFTVTGSTPLPPVVSPATGTKITWAAPVTNSDGSALTNLAGFRFYTGSAKVAELGPTVTSWNPPASNTYDLVSYTTVGAECAHVQVAFVLAIPPQPVEVWKVAVSGTAADRPVAEPVQNLTSTALIKGGDQGRIAVGKICGAQAFKSGTSSYRYVTESDVSLTSPTYKGRQHVAICTKAP
jgi:hypothetical protein